MPELHFAVWVCAGISDTSSDTPGSPPVSPRSRSDSPGPCPWPSGVPPCRFGSAKFDLPSPPYVVPRSENSAVFWLIGRIWPLQNAQPLGGKLKGNIRISATKGLAICAASARLIPGSFSCLAWENAEQRNDEIDDQERRHIVVRLVPARRPDCSCRHC